MAFDIGAVLQDMLNAATHVLSDEGPRVQGALGEVLQDQKAALQAIAEARLSGEITAEEALRQLEDEKATFEAGLAMVSAVGKAALQRAINAALDVFWKAVTSAVYMAI